MHSSFMNFYRTMHKFTAERGIAITVARRAVSLRQHRLFLHAKRARSVR